MSQRSTLFLMANLGSALMRTFSWLQSEEKDLSEVGRKECLKIIDQILTNNDSAGAVAEAGILRNLLISKGDIQLTSNVKRNELEVFFLPFSARLMPK